MCAPPDFRDFGSLLCILLMGTNPLPLRSTLISGKAEVPLDEEVQDEAENRILFVSEVKLMSTWTSGNSLEWNF